MIQIDLGMKTLIKLDPFSERDTYVAEAWWKPAGKGKRKSTGGSFNGDKPADALRALAQWLDGGGWDAIGREVYPNEWSDVG